MHVTAPLGAIQDTGWLTRTMTFGAVELFPDVTGCSQTLPYHPSWGTRRCTLVIPHRPLGSLLSWTTLAHEEGGRDKERIPATPTGGFVRQRALGIIGGRHDEGDALMLDDVEPKPVAGFVSAANP